MVFERLLAAGDVDQAYLLWSSAWESLLIDRVESAGDTADLAAIGRGKGPGYREYLPRSSASKTDGTEVPPMSP
eukprot:930650-Amphidinium_carterae.1